MRLPPVRAGVSRMSAHHYHTLAFEFTQSLEDVMLVKFQFILLIRFFLYVKFMHEVIHIFFTWIFVCLSSFCHSLDPLRYDNFPLPMCLSFYLPSYIFDV